MTMISNTCTLFTTTAAAALLVASTVAFAQGQKNEEGTPKAPPTSTPNVQAPGEATPKAPNPQPQQNLQRQPQAESPQQKPAQAQTQQPQQPKKQDGTAQSPEASPPADKKGMANDNNTQQPNAKQSDAPNTSSGTRTQISEKQRTDVHTTILKERTVNRATNVNISVSIGARIPRNVKLVALPVAVVNVVPGYRTYHYVVVNDDICIVNPATYEIVEVIPAGSLSAARTVSGPALTLSVEEKNTILALVEFRDDSTLALGTLSVGSEIPRSVQLTEFDDRVTQQVPKVRGYKYFTADNRVAVVDKGGAKIELLIEKNR